MSGLAISCTKHAVREDQRPVAAPTAQEPSAGSAQASHEEAATGSDTDDAAEEAAFKERKDAKVKERCDVALTALVKYASSIKMPPPEQRLEYCAEITEADERCLLRATDQASYDHCNERINKTECETMVAYLTKHYGTERFPPERQKTMLEQCPGKALRSDYECLTATDTTMWNCTSPITEPKPY